MHQIKKYNMYKRSRSSRKRNRNKNKDSSKIKRSLISSEEIDMMVESVLFKKRVFVYC